MKTEYDVRVVAFDGLEKLPESWQDSHYSRMLLEMDYGETSGMPSAELREMTLMSLQEREPTEAAEVVLKCRFGERLRDGQVKNCSHEMLDEKLWEHHSEMSFHEDFFHAGSLLFEAFPLEFPTPDAVRIQLEVQARDAAGIGIFSHPVAEPFVVRLLSDGMSETAVLHRLFEDQLGGGPFPEAEWILWIMHQEMLSKTTLRLEVVSSSNWLAPLKDVDAYVSDTPDRS